MQTKPKLQIKYRKDESYHQLFMTSKQSQILNQENSIRLQNALLGKRGTRSNKGKNLKQIFLKNKVRLITSNFIRKLRRNSTSRPPLQDLQDQKSNSYTYPNFFTNIGQKLNILFNLEGLLLNNWVFVIWNGFNIIQSLLLVFIFSVMTAFADSEVYAIFFYIKVVSSCLFSFDIMLNLLSQRFQNGKKLLNIGQIAKHYYHNGLTVDLVMVALLFISLFVETQLFNVFVTFVAIVKLMSNVREFEKYQYLIITNNQKQQYFGLIKVFLTNFIIGHFLSVILNLMPSLNSQQNWHIKLGVANQPWSKKYIWGYYWGTNIMLTVGFGDITATNSTEAIILVFIQTFSCITLAYNISTVGALIGSIRQNQQAKKKKLKIFHRMCKQNSVNCQIQSKISNFIQQSYQIKQNFQNHVREEVIQFLPKQMQRQYRKQANKILFDNLGFLKNLSKRSLLALAQQVNCRICHPEQIVFRIHTTSDFCILQKGCLTMSCKIRSNLDGKVIENLTVQKDQKPKILSLDFIKNKRISYNIKSLNYSILYFLSRQNFMEALKGSEMDYQLFCMLKDKDEHIIDQNNLYPCKNCKNQFHNKFECTRLHYIPLKQNVIIRYLNKSSHHKQSRTKFPRTKLTIDAIFMQKQLVQSQQRFIQDNFDPEHYRQIQQLIKFYQNNEIIQNDYKNQNTLSLLQAQSIQNSTQFLKIISDKEATQLSKSKKLEKSLMTKSRMMSKKNRKRHTPFQVHLKNLIEQKQIYKLVQLMQKQANKKQNNFWDFQIDLAYNSRYYFIEGNPQNLRRIKKRRYKNLYNLLD